MTSYLWPARDQQVEGGAEAEVQEVRRHVEHDAVSQAAQVCELRRRWDGALARGWREVRNLDRNLGKFDGYFAIFWHV